VAVAVADGVAISAPLVAVEVLEVVVLAVQKMWLVQQALLV
jgi:hypothetical protein